MLPSWLRLADDTAAFRAKSWPIPMSSHCCCQACSADIDCAGNISARTATTVADTHFGFRGRL